jgi:uncharacterized membrane protein YebE (DUF533 family)
MFNAKGLLDQLVGSGVAGGLAGGLAGGALANVLSGKKARKLAGSALQVGGLALVGGLAYKAWKSYQQGAPQAGQAAGMAPAAGPVGQAAFIPESGDAAGAAALSTLLVRAMISAAKADGQIDIGESQKILEQINGLELPADDRAFLFEEYARPLDVQALCAAVDSPEHAAEVYAASLLMLDPPSAPEQIYLDGLARELGLDAALVNEITHTVRGFEAVA